MIIRLHPFSLLRCTLLIGWLTLAAMAHAESLAIAAGEPTAQETTAPRILVLGDSISAAYGMSLEQGWVAIMASGLAEDFPGLEVINASISGETSVGGLARLPPLLEQHRPTLVIIELGGNDGLRGYPVKQLRANLTDMVLLSQAAGAEVLLLPMEIPPNYGARYTRAFRESFDHVAQETGARLGPFILQDVALHSELMQSDGIHPTPQAQPTMAAAAQPAIRQILETL